MIEDAGFEPLYLSGAAFGRRDGAADRRALQLTELVQAVTTSRREWRSGDCRRGTGFLRTVNVERMLPNRSEPALRRFNWKIKMCRAVRTPLGKTLVEEDVMCAKLRAGPPPADHDTVIIARTDARASEGFDRGRTRQAITWTLGGSVSRGAGEPRSSSKNLPMRWMHR